MKKIILFNSILLTIYTYAQSDSGLLNRSLSDIINYDIKSPNNNKSIEGSPYLSDQFILSRISNVKNITETRYNAYTDEIEFKSANNIYIIPKDTVYSTITQQNGSVFTLINGEYFIDLYTNKNASFLLKQKISVSLNDSKVKNGYSITSNVHSYEKDEEKYFIYYKGKLYEISKNIKSFVNEVNINKITEFMKNNKIIVKDTNSVRKLVDFLASIQ
ncbi:hypothetical protein DSC47_16925 [Elizabethkingia miricola]|uniref:hypothetical protein n=1 Tax=Elizabethkingia bruuniana TaxID=1756149 RepID=UPI00099A753F|nr:hypothetical protein [Elizabethkingia bruuniana]OPC52476.1 hypothetical protein BAY07_12745 [Elizabethkingia bruuniana]OPC60372.1 hypothetical protein BAY13_08240 [Elizabethkingia bruuniana]RBI89749.1 hypothetical protein DSC47_16925 [Elizabethkingia miricola]